MFVFLRRDALLTIAETKDQYDDAVTDGYRPFFQVEDAAYARAFFHAWYGLSCLIADGYIHADKLQSDTFCSENLIQAQNVLSAAGILPELRRYSANPRDKLLDDESYMDATYVLVHPTGLSCELTCCYDHSCLLETQGYTFIRVDTLEYAYAFRDGFEQILGALYDDILMSQGYHAVEAFIKSDTFQEASLPISSERYVDQQTLKELYPPVHRPDIHVISMRIKEGGGSLHTLVPETNRSELGYADGQRAARVFCRDLLAQSVSPTFLVALCQAVTAS